MRRHTPVLLEETLERISSGASVIMDGTLGHAGHTEYFLKEGYKVVGVDRDQAMIDKAMQFLSERVEEGELTQKQLDNLKTFQGSYVEFPKIVEKTGYEKFDYIFLDIGVNMDHFKEGERGFSIKRDGPLDMRYDRSMGISVAEWLKRANYPDMYEVFEKYADFSERYTEWITRKLNNAQKNKPFETTGQVRAWAQDLGINDKVLAVIFQSRRIYVNNELGQLDLFLGHFSDYVSPGGRVAIISYHSGEDRRVKNSFKSLEKAGKGNILTKSVVTPERKEKERNKASRSAKMRVFELSDAQ